MSVAKTLKQRQKTHGSFTDHARVSQGLKSVLQAEDSYKSLDNCQKEALDMIMHKVARILSGNPSFADHWHDIAGYATLVEKQCE